MSKPYLKRLLTGSIVFLLFTILLMLVLIKPISKSYIEHYDLKSYYVSSDIDFVIPEPGIDQIRNLTNDNNTGIKEVTPYYSIGRLNVNEKEIINANGFIFSDATDLNKSPYYSENILSGSQNIKDGQAVVDKTFSTKYNCKIGDSVSFSLNEKTYVFIISAISSNNMSTQKGTVAIILTDEMLTDFRTQNIKFSGAYVFAKDYDACKNYLKNEYKPLGNLKDRSSFESDELYNKYLETFNSANWFLSTVDFHEVYATESVKYTGIESKTLMSLIVGSLILSIGIICIALWPLLGKSNTKMLATLFRKHLRPKKFKTVIILYVLVNLMIALLIASLFTSPRDVFDSCLYGFAYIYVMPFVASVCVSLWIMKRVNKINDSMVKRNEV